MRSVIDALVALRLHWSSSRCPDHHYHNYPDGASMISTISDSCNIGCERTFPKPWITSDIYNFNLQIQLKTTEYSRIARLLTASSVETDSDQGLEYLVPFVIALLRVPGFPRVLLRGYYPEIRELIVTFVRRAMSTSTVHDNDNNQPQPSAPVTYTCAAAWLIHELLNPLQPDALSPTDLMIFIDVNNFPTQMRALLESCCKHMFYSDGAVVSPDDVVSDILLWLAGKTWYTDAQYLDVYMPLWLHLVQRALISPYSKQPSTIRMPEPFSATHSPSERLQRNLARLTTCDRFFWRNKQTSGGGEGTSEERSNQALAQCAAVAIAELQLRLWASPTGRAYGDPTPSHVLECVSRSLSGLGVENVETVRNTLERLHGHVRHFRHHPMELFERGTENDERVHTEARQCVPQLEALENTLRQMLQTQRQQSHRKSERRKESRMHAHGGGTSQLVIGNGHAQPNLK